ncbi:MAG: hypothetical protein LBU41_05885, partial [Clostridiales Family XIII bacterium]|nr:hypothetical protein [Clostridiales Family XIII bacterium]
MKVLNTRRKVMAAMALVFAVMIAFGGVTLMLLTAESYTATNTVTVGDCGIELWETNIATDAGGEPLIANKPFDLGKFIPGDLIDKKPWVKNTGDTDVYVFVELTFWTTGGTPATLDGSGAPIPGTGNNTAAVFDEFLVGIVPFSAWSGPVGVGDETIPGAASGLVPNVITVTDPDDGSSYTAYQVGYFYTNASAGLMAVPKDDGTSLGVNISQP